MPSGFVFAHPATSKYTLSSSTRWHVAVTRIRPHSKLSLRLNHRIRDPQRVGILIVHPIRPTPQIHIAVLDPQNASVPTSSRSFNRHRTESCGAVIPARLIGRESINDRGLVVVHLDQRAERASVTGRPERRRIRRSYGNETSLLPRIFDHRKVAVVAPSLPRKVPDRHVPHIGWMSRTSHNQTGVSHSAGNHRAREIKIHARSRNGHPRLPGVLRGRNDNRSHSPSQYCSLESEPPR